MLVSIKNITPEYANTLLSRNDNNRPLSAKTVERYALEMKAGKWLPNGEAVKVDNSGCLLDGQHRLAACVKSGVNFDCVVVEGLPKSVFTTLDTGRKRSAADVLNVSGYKYATSLASTAKFLMVWERGTRSIGSFNCGTGATNAEVMAYVRSNPELVESCGVCRTQYAKAYKLVGTNASIGLFHLFNKKDPASAHEFFDKFSSGDHNDQNDLIFLMRERLISMMISGKGLRAGVKLQIIIRAWNKYRAGVRTGSVKYTPEQPVPEVK